MELYKPHGIRNKKKLLEIHMGHKCVAIYGSLNYWDKSSPLIEIQSIKRKN